MNYVTKSVLAWCCTGFLILAGCDNKGVTIPSNTAVASIPGTPQVAGINAGGGAADTGKPGFAK
jgi:hypothetical protein